MEKREYIKRLALFLHDNGAVMSVNELAQHLNRNNFRTNYGTTYKGGRGTYTLVSTTYDWFFSIGQVHEAGKVAMAFTNSKGDHAFK